MRPHHPLAKEPAKFNPFAGSWNGGQTNITGAGPATDVVALGLSDTTFLSSGLQNARGTENALPVGSLGVWHVPQYLPGYPTAATIWPRVIFLQCTADLCAGYTITPEVGRGEYLFFVPADK